MKKEITWEDWWLKAQELRRIHFDEESPNKESSMKDYIIYEKDTEGVETVVAIFARESDAQEFRSNAPIYEGHSRRVEAE